MCLEELGPTFIKFGQILSTRTDLLSQDILFELKKLQDEVPPVAFEQIQKILKAQYPQGAESIFEWIESKPVGSASIAQVHRARLRSGASVVLKIQKPGIQQTLSEDVEVLRFLAEALDTWVVDFKKYNLIGMVEEFAQTIQQEINFLLEAQNTQRFYENFKNRESIVVPRPYVELSGARVFVMEYIEGSSLNDFAASATLAQKKNLAERSLTAYVSMVFTDGLFHADLHSGNLLVVDGKHLALVDFGMVGRLSKRLQRGIINVFLSLSQEDYEKMAIEYIELAAVYQSVDRDKLTEDLRKIFAPYNMGSGVSGANVAGLMMEAAAVAFKHDLKLPSELLLLFRSLLVLEGVAKSLCVDLDWLSFITKRAAETQSPQDPLKMMGEFAMMTREFSALTRTLPLELRSYWRKKNHPSYAEQVEIKNLDELVKAQIKSAKIIFFALIVSSLIISLTLILINQSV